MNAREMQKADLGTPLEVPLPVLFNTYKHHAGALRARIQQAAAIGEPALIQLADHLVVLGAKLMDLYTGQFWPRDISLKVLNALQAQNRLDLVTFRRWVDDQGGYTVVTLEEDESKWVLRIGDEEERYIHLHPGRWSPATVRVRANVLKTAFLVLIYARIHGADPMDRGVVNLVRRDYLGLSPVGKDLEGELGLGSVIDILRQEPVGQP